MSGWLWRELEDEPTQALELTLRFTYKQRAREGRFPSDVPSELVDYIADHLTYLHKEADVDFIVYGVEQP